MALMQTGTPGTSNAQRSPGKRTHRREYGYLASLRGAARATPGLVAFLVLFALPAASWAESAPAPAPGPSGLPDGRTYEQVSPQFKNGNEAGVDNVGPRYGVAAADGNSALYYQTGPFGVTESGIDFYSAAHREATGWSAHAAIPAAKGFDESNFFYSQPQQLVPSAGFNSFLFTALGTFTVSDPPVQPGSESSEGIFLSSERASSEGIEPAWLSQPTIPFSEAKPNPGAFDGAALGPVGGSSDLGTVYFNAKATLVEADASRAQHVSPNGQGPQGFYEWDAGQLISAGVLPNGEVSEYGATAAATPDFNWESIKPGLLNNEVSSDGSKAFFVSPDPRFAVAAGSPTELYVREHTPAGPRSLLVSRDELLPPTGSEPTPAPGSGDDTAVIPMVPGSTRPYVYASPDGSHAIFQSMDKLARSSSGSEPEGAGPWTYDFDLETETVTWLPGVLGPVLAASANGSRFIFEKLEKLPPLEPLLEECEFGFVEGPECEGTLQPVAVDLWDDGSVSEVASWLTPSVPSFSSARATSDGSAFLFDTNAVLSPGSFQNTPSQPQVYRYAVDSAQLTCISCPAPGTTVTGGAVLSNDESDHSFLDSRGMSVTGERVFFDTQLSRLTEIPQSCL
ncbi:MAG: hypothetical protein ACRDK7_01640 [Solirubrobacteraceae bacterium]